ncbi:MAG: ABC transporter ATP-binding protein [Planctomycetes bacterium]|nr:ABC transporter ATP-binding protein [Planctomycetota bacterium]
MIKLENLTKHYGDKIAVFNLNLEIPYGELFAFIGPNGAGKTTTVKMMVGLLKPTFGSVSIYGHNIHRQKEYLEAKKMLAYIPDQPFVYDKLSGREFLKFVGHVYKMEKDVFKQALDKYVAMFEMGEYIDQLTETYSLGMKQRLIISASFLHQPARGGLIVVDEPLVGLDPASIKLVKDLFRKEVKENGRTIFMSTHLLSVAEETADRIGIINRGQLLTVGTLQELKARAKQEGLPTEAWAQAGDLEDVFMALTQNCSKAD